MNERCTNVYENKESLWKTRQRSWNVAENKQLTRHIPVFS